MKTIAKHLALVMLVMFNLQASAQTCSFMQALGGVNDQLVPSQVIPTLESSVHPSPLPAIPLGGSSSKSGSVSSPAQSSPVYTFKKATSITSGRRYMIVANSKNKFYAARLLVSNSSDFQSDEVTLNNDKISTTNLDLAFTFEGNDDNNYVIWQSNGTYLVNIDNNLSDYVYIKWSTAINNSYGVWKVVDRGSFTDIKNTKTGRYFVFLKSKVFHVQTSNSTKNVNLYEEILTEVPVSVSAVGYATLYYEDRALKVPEGVTAMTYAYNETAQSLVVSKTYEAGSVIPAGVAVVLKAQPGEYTFTVSDEEGDKPASNLFGYSVPSKTRVSGMSKYYMLSLNAQNDPNSVGFYWGEDNGAAFSSGAHKAFLALPESASAKGFAFDDVANTVSGVSTTGNGTDAPVYSLMGVRMTGKLPAGVYVTKGKKFVVR